MDLTPYFQPGSEVIAPEDILAYKVRNYLAADEKLLAIFGAECIEIVPLLANGLDFREGPLLQVAAFSAAETQGVGNTDTKDPITLYIRIRYDLAAWLPLDSGGSVKLAWPYGIPSVATLVAHIVTYLKSKGMFDETFPNGTVAPLLAEKPLFGPFSFSADSPDGARLWFNHDIQVNLTVRLEHDGAYAGKIHNAAANGG